MVRTKNKKGFTLVELLICVAILAVLAAISIPIISGFVDNANDRSDKLMSELFSSYMTKYANEDPGPKENYTQLSASEQFLVPSAGMGYFPGTNAIANNAVSTDEQAWEAIRREAIVAMKMYGEEIIVSDGYYIAGPKNTQNNYIYYYLTGKVAVEELDEVIERTEKNLADGKDTPDNYWVALDTNAGNAEASTTTTTGNVYINLYYYGLGIPHSVGDLKCDANNDIYLVNTLTNQKFYLTNNDSSNDTFELYNVLQFSNVTKGTYQLYIKSYMVTDIPSNEYGQLGSFTTSGTITVSDSGYAGMTPGHPYRAYLLAVAHGNVAVYYKTGTFNNNGQVGSYVTHNFEGKYYDLNFQYVPTKSNDQGVTFRENYNLNNKYITALYDTARSKYLPYGTYDLTFTSSGYHAINDRIVSSRYGIYSESNPKNASSEFNYDLVARKEVVTIAGTIDLGTGSMPLNAALTADERNKLSNTYAVTLSTTAIDTKILFMSDDGKYTYELSVSDLTDQGNGVYSYNLQNVQWDGTGTNYHVYFKNTFHGINIPVKITTNPTFVEGFDITGNYTVSNYFPQHTISTSVFAKSQDVTSNIAGNVTYKNVYTGATYNCAHLGTVTLPDGFYEVTLNYPTPYNVTNDKVKVLVCSSNLVFTYTRTFAPITISGIITPTSGTTYISGTNANFYSYISMSLTFTNVDGTTGTRAGTISKNSTNKASYTITVPLAKSYSYSFTNSDSKCFNNVTSSYTPTVPNATTTVNHNMAQNSSTAETSHRGGMSYQTINDTSHKVFCDFCTKQLANHTAATEKVDKKATCEATGTRHYECNTCKRTNNTYTIPKRNHDYGSSVKKDSTCYSVGTTTYTCKNKTATTYYTACTSTYDKDDIGKKDHVYSSSYTVTKKATCEATGTKEKRCQNFANCQSYTGRTTIAKRNHNYKGSRASNPTCETWGSTLYKCQNTSGTAEYVACTSQYTSWDVAPISCNKSGTSIRKSAATCQALEVRYYVCSMCGETNGTYTTGSYASCSMGSTWYKYSNDASTGCRKKCIWCSSWGPGTSHISNGTTYYTTSQHYKYCKYCYGYYGYTNHSMSGWKTDDKSSDKVKEANHTHYKTCSGCSYKDSVTGVTYSWSLDKLYYCATCGYNPKTLW